MMESGPDFDYLPTEDEIPMDINGEAHILTNDAEIDVLKLDMVREPSTVQEDMDDAFIPPDDNTDDEEVELSPGGILDEETIGRGLTNLGRSADGVHQVYLHCTIAGFGLIDISLLAEYVHLQRVEISYNDVTDLSPLGNLPNLIILDASHNKVHKLLDFTPPKNLREVDLSFNHISEMTDLSAHHSLTKLILDNNQISELKGLDNCRRLTHLSLAHNLVDRIQGLDGLPLQVLTLCHNKIKKIENLETLKYLRQVNLASNGIRSLKGLENHQLLEEVDLEDNEVIDIYEMTSLSELLMLRRLNLLRNPIQELPDYRLSILYRLQRLMELDHKKVDVEEKVDAINMFNPPLEVVAARDHIMHVVYSFLQPSRVWDSTLPNPDTPYPMLVLVGPQGSGKRDLALKLVEEFSDYFGYAVTHTSRKPLPDEISGRDYHFTTLEKFEMDIKMGQFLQTTQFGGNWYGLQMESIEAVAREGLACILHMELEGVLSLKNTCFEPRYVLILPMNSEPHEQRMRDRKKYAEQQIEYAMKRAQMYAEYNQEHPGFFDMMINTDDIVDAYRRLRRLVMDYLGISSVGTSVTSENPYTATDTQAVTETYQTYGPGSTNQMGARTWSKPSIPDSMSQRGRVQSPTTSRGIVEEESLRRRQSAAKEAMAGYVPPLYEQILSNYPKTAPMEGGGDGVEGLGGVGSREISAPSKLPPQAAQEGLAGEAVVPSSPDSTVSKGLSSSRLSDLDSAAELQRGGGPTSPGTSQPTRNILPTETVNPIELINEEGYSSAKQKLAQPRPPSAPRSPADGRMPRPGSDHHRILPPINPNPPPAQMVQ